MTGWNLTLQRPPQNAGIDLEQAMTRLHRIPEAAVLGGWYARATGLRWADLLVRSERAAVRGDGYPYLYVLRARDVVEALVEHGGPPEPRTSPAVRSGDTTWGPRTHLVAAISRAAVPTDWLVLVAYDES